MTSDSAGSELWTIDKATGVGTVHTAISLPVNYQLASLVIDANDGFTVFAHSDDLGQPSEFFNLNPNTGATIPIADSPLSNSIFPNSMSFDPQNGNVYGILEDRTTDNPRTYTLAHITGIPEPATISLLGLALPALLMRRRRK